MADSDRQWLSLPSESVWLCALPRPGTTITTTPLVTVQDLVACIIVRNAAAVAAPASTTFATAASSSYKTSSTAWAAARSSSLTTRDTRWASAVAAAAVDVDGEPNPGWWPDMPATVRVRRKDAGDASDDPGDDNGVPRRRSWYDVLRSSVGTPGCGGDSEAIGATPSWGGVPSLWLRNSSGEGRRWRGGSSAASDASATSGELYGPNTVGLPNRPRGVLRATRNGVAADPVVTPASTHARRQSDSVSTVASACIPTTRKHRQVARCAHCVAIPASTSARIVGSCLHAAPGRRSASMVRSDRTSRSTAPGGIPHAPSPTRTAPASAGGGSDSGTKSAPVVTWLNPGDGGG